MSTSESENMDVDDSEHKIQNAYTFWYHRRRGDKKNVDYNESTKQIETFGSIEQFWAIYDHIARPNDFKVTTDYHLFKKGIKPTWEDPANNSGGKWMVRLKKGLASRYWEELVLAIIGEQFDVGQEICGAVVSVRNSEDIISVWNRNSDNKEATNKIRDQMRRILKLPVFIQIEYKKHVDAKADGSSFRNPSMVWKASPRSGGENNHATFKNKGSEGGFHDKRTGNSRNATTNNNDRDGGDKRTGWKDRTERERSANNQSTGDPAKDAENAAKAKEERERPQHRERLAPSTQGSGGSSWGSANNNGSKPAWASAGTGTSDKSPRTGTFKTAPMPAIAPLRTEIKKDSKESSDGNPHIWSRASRITEENS